MGVRIRGTLGKVVATKQIRGWGIALRTTNPRPQVCRVPWSLKPSSMREGKRWLLESKVLGYRVSGLEKVSGMERGQGLGGL